MIRGSAFGAGAAPLCRPPTQSAAAQGDEAARRSAVEIVRYEPAHLRRLVVENAQSYLRPLVEDETYAEGLARAGPNWSAIADNHVIGIGGFFEPWGGRAIAHAILASTSGPFLSAVVRAIRRGIAATPYDRIEAHVRSSREECHRFARLCGFARVATLRRFQAGDDFDLYEIVKGSPPKRPASDEAAPWK